MGMLIVSKLINIGSTVVSQVINSGPTDSESANKYWNIVYADSGPDVK